MYIRPLFVELWLAWWCVEGAEFVEVFAGGCGLDAADDGVVPLK